MLPLQSPVMQRVRADGRLSVRKIDGRTRLHRLFQEGAAKIRFPAPESAALEAVLINTAGGLTGGDRVAWAVDAAADTALSLTTQACEKIYRADSGRAQVEVALKAATGARLSWLPQETILFDGAALSRRLDIDLAADASALILEATIFGRQAMGESVERAIFHDRWRVRRAGRLVHAEDFRIGPDVAAQLSHPAIAGGGRAVATLLFIDSRAEEMLAPARALTGEAGGVSFWNVGRTGKLLARIVAEDGYALRQRLLPLVRLLNGQAGLPKIWTS
ncbi:urease accessory protein UreD [Aliihoeflea sp. PC F10.4]